MGSKKPVLVGKVFIEFDITKNRIVEVGGMGARSTQTNNQGRVLTLRNGHTDGRTNGGTDPLIEMRGRI